MLRRGSGGARRRPAGRSGAGLEELGARSPDVQVRIPQAETQKKAEYRRPKPRLGISAFGFRPPFGPRVSGFGFEPLRPRVGGAVQTRPCKGGAGGARHAECCVLAHDDLANLLGWHLLGLLSGILERRGPPGTEIGRANRFAARACCCVAECADGVFICWKRGSFALPSRLAAVQGQELPTSSTPFGVSRRLTGRRFKAVTVCFHPWLN